MNTRCEVEARVVKECPWCGHRVQRTNGRCWFCNLTPAEAAERKANEDAIKGGSMETTEQLQSSGTGVEMEPVEPTDEELLAGIPDKPDGAPDCFGGDETSDACIDCDYAEACEQACDSGAYITDDGTEEAADGE